MAPLKPYRYPCSARWVISRPIGQLQGLLLETGYTPAAVEIISQPDRQPSVASSTSPRFIRTSRQSRQLGLTLIELVISMVIIAVSVSGILLVYITTTRYSGDPMERQQAIAIAEAYLEEITLQSYLDPDTDTVCPAKESARELYDNVCDYDGLDDNGAKDQTGSAIPGLGFYRVQVSIDQAATLASLNGSSEVLRVDVTVTPPFGDLFVVSGYRTNS